MRRQKKRNNGKKKTHQAREKEKTKRQLSARQFGRAKKRGNGCKVSKDGKMEIRG
jgi:hypothetical protein